MKVEVEIEDLETIIYATAAIKAIEGALVARKQDPFVQPHLHYKQAHDALVAAMNQARRVDADTQIKWDGELNEEETNLLEEFEDIPVFEVSGEYRKRHKEIDALMAKGCLRIGQLVAGAVWPGATQADIKPVEGYALAITPRGKEKYAKALIIAAKLS